MMPRNEATRSLRGLPCRLLVRGFGGGKLSRGAKEASLSAGEPDASGLRTRARTSSPPPKPLSQS
jgi:hypothetical protein